jgi:1-acyl-sn-glycerol-3-phosphate acyltransferase
LQEITVNNPANQRPDADRHGAFLSFDPERSLAFKLRILLKTLISATVLTLWSVVMLLVAIGTLFMARRLYNEYLAKWLAMFILWQWNIKVIVHNYGEIPREQVIYISNHTSTIDIFAVLSLGLSRCRYFLYGRLRRIIPLGIIATVMGTFFTFPQTQPEKRIRVFSNADKTLRRTGESVYLSPEGKRVTTGEIGKFNKGAFHLATSLKVPIVPFYIQIPEEINPGAGIDAEPGTIHIYFEKPIPTADWKLEDLVENKEMVRDLFLGYHRKHGSG